MESDFCKSELSIKGRFLFGRKVEMDKMKCFILTDNGGLFIRKHPFGGYKKVKYFSANCIFLGHEDPEAIAEHLNCNAEEFSIVKEQNLVK